MKKMERSIARNVRDTKLNQCTTVNGVRFAWKVLIIIVGFLENVSLVIKSTHSTYVC